MNSITISLLVFACITAAGYLAIRLRALLPETHLSADTKDTVKLAMALVATMTALLLSMLIASAKGTYDAERANVAATAGKIVMMDRLLAHYGPEAQEVRTLLRRQVIAVMAGLWPEQKELTQLDPSQTSGDALYNALQALTPANDLQRYFKAQAVTIAFDLGLLRWMTYVQAGASISVPLLIGVMVWLTILFFSFGLFAPHNGTAIAALALSALSVSGAIFLILELDQPFRGVVHISSLPMERALHGLGK